MEQPIHEINEQVVEHTTNTRTFNVVLREIQCDTGTAHVSLQIELEQHAITCLAQGYNIMSRPDCKDQLYNQKPNIQTT